MKKLEKLKLNDMQGYSTINEVEQTQLKGGIDPPTGDYDSNCVIENFDGDHEKSMILWDHGTDGNGGDTGDYEIWDWNASTEEWEKDKDGTGGNEDLLNDYCNGSNDDLTEPDVVS